MVQTQIGACFAIKVDGKTRSYRDRKEIAIEAGEYLEQMQPQSEVIVRDVRDNSITVIEREKTVVLDLVAASNKVLRAGELIPAVEHAGQEPALPRTITGEPVTITHKPGAELASPIFWNFFPEIRRGGNTASTTR